MENVIVVYGKLSGYAAVVTFLGNQWWNTSKDQTLEPLFEEPPYRSNDYRYLCEKDRRRPYPLYRCDRQKAGMHSRSGSYG